MRLSQSMLSLILSLEEQSSEATLSVAQSDGSVAQRRVQWFDAGFGIFSAPLLSWAFLWVSFVDLAA